MALCDVRTLWWCYRTSVPRTEDPSASLRCHHAAGCSLTNSLQLMNVCALLTCVVLPLSSSFSSTVYSALAQQVRRTCTTIHLLCGLFVGNTPRWSRYMSVGLRGVAADCRALNIPSTHIARARLCCRRNGISLQQYVVAAADHNGLRYRRRLGGWLHGSGQAVLGVHGHAHRACSPCHQHARDPSEPHS